MKLHDVYRFSYHPDPSITHDRYWCFDGQLVVKARGDGLVLVDTYWSSEARTFTPEEAEKQGELTFVCNLDEVEECKDHYCYAKEDVFNLSYQKGCYPRMVKRKGAQRSRDAMLAHVRGKLTEARQKAESAIRSVEWAAAEAKQVEMAPDLDKLYI